MLQQIKQLSAGTTVDTITIIKAKKYLTPLPPLAEQQRIVEKIESLLPFVDVYVEADQELTALNNRFPEDLKKSILQVAVQGKLVEQDPADEPATVLLERIKAEKEQLLKEKKIKKEKVSSFIFKGEDGSYYENIDGEIKCIDDEIPFEIPESWAWVRLGKVVQINPRNKLEDDLNVSFIPMALIDDGYKKSHTSEQKLWREIKSGFTHFRNGDIGIAKITPCFQNLKSVIFTNLTNGYGAGTTELHILRPFSSSILPLYLLWFAKNPIFIGDGKSTFTGTAGQQRVGKNFIENYLFPLPPLAEQQRIVGKVNTLLAMCDKLSG